MKTYVNSTIMLILSAIVIVDFVIDLVFSCPADELKGDSTLGLYYLLVWLGETQLINQLSLSHTQISTVQEEQCKKKVYCDFGQAGYRYKRQNTSSALAEKKPSRGLIFTS